MSFITEQQSSATMVKPEFPRPDFERKDWCNLNGTWQFQFDEDDCGIKEGFIQSELPQGRCITVPFSWASPLSQIGENKPGIAWYQRDTQWQPNDADSRIFLRFGAVDFQADVWVNGRHMGQHKGGYSPFDFEVTEAWMIPGKNTIVVRVEDQDKDFQARGKQGYGEIRGIWQTVWLEARPKSFLDEVRFITSIDGTIQVDGIISAQSEGHAALRFEFAGGSVSANSTLTLRRGVNPFSVILKVEDPKLWSPEEPYLYEGTISVHAEDSNADEVSTYFGIREFTAARYGDRPYQWLHLNGKPIYLNGTLDQAFHKDGYFTYPTDDDMRDEIWRLKRLGLNFVRIHIKPEEPRKLYYADKIGMLVMEDMPCFWGEPTEEAQVTYELEALSIIQRDFNHPSIISWVMFNETWGLFGALEDGRRVYQPATQDWVRRVYHFAKSQDPTRLIEDNSACNYDHVESDLHTWHFYLNGYKLLRDHVQQAVDSTYEGSTWNYIGGHVQTDAPLMNSECGAVWGVDGSAGDSDIAWQYRYMLNEFRRHEKLCGFVFTEFHDVVNEFNGYYRIDNADKHFGFEWFHPDAGIDSLHTADFVAIDGPPCQTVTTGQSVDIKLVGSSFSDAHHGEDVCLRWQLWFDDFGKRTVWQDGGTSVQWSDYGTIPLPCITVDMPPYDSVAIFVVQLVSAAGEIVTTNFTTFDVQSGQPGGVYALDGQWVSVRPTDGKASDWKYHWLAMGAQKANFAPHGFVEYEVDITGISSSDTQNITVYFEAGAKRVLGKDIQQVETGATFDYMHGARPDVGENPNSYYMTDDETEPSIVNVFIDGHQVDKAWLPDDPADSRGVLSWHYQQEDRKLEEAGSYGYLQTIRIPSRLIPTIAKRGSFTLRLSVSDKHSLPGGLAIYGRNAGRYPIDIVVHAQ